MFRRLLIFLYLPLNLFLIFSSCNGKEQSRNEILYEQHCASCHIAPDIQDLPKDIWKNNILPEMGARMGISTPGYNPFEGHSYNEIEAIIASQTYPLRPSISNEDWNNLKEYIISLAPDSLSRNYKLPELKKNLTQFTTYPVKLDENPGSYITYLEYLAPSNEVAIGDMQGVLRMYNFNNDSISRPIRSSSPIIAYNRSGGNEYLTQIGRLNPSEISSGAFLKLSSDSLVILQDRLHRPVHTLAEDLDDDGNPEFVISEFGHLTGKVRMITNIDNGSSDSRILLDQPGVIRTIAKDMNKDGKKDLVMLTSQGDEGISILYQDGPLEFRREKVIQFSPVYGSSWFEVIDYDNDGDMDIATVNGDNADKSYIDKPYHGLRIYLNDGNNNFKQSYFFPLNGATRFLARDFDQDQDMDFAIIATFPNYQAEQIRSFVYLENKDEDAFNFSASTFQGVEKTRWFLMDAGDIDGDDDLDIILSSFSYSFIHIPKTVEQIWRENDIDLMVLQNNLKQPANQ